MYRDRNDNYVPTDLYLSGPPHLTEVNGEPVQVALGKADELNRDQRDWWWADVSGDGTHWSRFNGHRVQVDVELHTENRREVNDWKGRDEIRAEGTWTISLARQQCWDGCVGTDFLSAFSRIPQLINQLLEHAAIDWTSTVSAESQLVGRRIYYDRTPAYISSASVLHQGCVMIRPVGMNLFPLDVCDMDRPEEADASERDELKVSLLGDKIWWWRDRAYGEEDPAKQRTYPPVHKNG